MARPKKPKPKTEIELARLQDLYVKDKKKYQNEYMILLKSYARSLALKEIKGKITLPPNRIEEVAIVATLKLLDQYERNPEWRVWASFGGTLRWKVVEALYEDYKEESHLSLNAVIGESQNRELGDLMVSLGFDPLFHQFEIKPEDLINKDLSNVERELEGILQEAYEVLPYYYMLIFELYLNLLIRRPKSRDAIKRFKQHYITSNKMEEIFDTLLLEIRKRLNVF